MAIPFTKRNILDRISTTDNQFTIEDVAGGKKKLTPDTSGVQVEGTKINKDLLQRYENTLDNLTKEIELYVETIGTSQTTISLPYELSNFDYLILTTSEGYEIEVRVSSTMLIQVGTTTRTMTYSGSNLTLNSGNITITNIKGRANTQLKTLKCVLTISHLTSTSSQIIYYSVGERVNFTLTPDIGYGLPQTIEFSDNITDAEYDNETGEVSFTAPDEDSTISANGDNDLLNKLSWAEIKATSENGNAKTRFTISLTKKVLINNYEHLVRIIGFDHDVDANNQTCGITFELANLISDANGYSLASYWKNTNTTAGSNYDYLNSSIRRALTGEGSGDLHWFEKDSKTFSTRYTGSVLSMLPSDLVNVIKNVKKKVNINNGGTWTLTEYTDKLFLLATKEMGYESQYAEDLPVYEYYRNATAQTDAIRIKYQPKHHDGARTEALSGSDLDGEYSGTKYSYAGYNNTTDANGGIYWWRSPYTDGDNGAWNVDDGGGIGHNRVYHYAIGVAPAFCI